MQCALQPVLTMTRPIQLAVCRRQVDAAADLRKTMMLLLILLVFSLSSFSSVAAECPSRCDCYNTTVRCPSLLNLDRIPNGIPPATTFLDMEFNNINVIEPNALTHLTELESLYLGLNNICDLKNGVFANLSKLQKFSPGTFNSLTSLGRFRIEDNPFMCDCDILWFVNVLQTTDFLMRSPTCRFPVGMSGKPLIEITEGDLHCSSPDVIVEPEYKTLSVGEQLLLSCKAAGEPKPFITWVKDDVNLELGQRVQVFQNNTLIISNVERTDGGHYKCLASNHLGRKSSEAVVNVNGLAANGCNTMFGEISSFFIITIILVTYELMSS